jgi:hypothetical protein
MYDEDGKVSTRLGKPVERPPGSKTPCLKCPKKSPDQAHEYELSQRNIEALIAYRRIRALHGRCLSDEEAQDGMLGKNMAIIDTIIRNHETGDVASAMMNVMALTSLTNQQKQPPITRGR